MIKPPKMRPIKSYKGGGEVMSEGENNNLPSLSLDETQLEEIAEWEVGKEYTIVLKVKQTGAKEIEYGGKKGNIEGQFKIMSAIPAEEYLKNVEYKEGEDMYHDEEGNEAENGAKKFAAGGTVQDVTGKADQGVPAHYRSKPLNMGNVHVVDVTRTGSDKPTRYTAADYDAKFRKGKPSIYTLPEFRKVYDMPDVPAAPSVETTKSNLVQTAADELKKNAAAVLQKKNGGKIPGLREIGQHDIR